MRLARAAGGIVWRETTSGPIAARHAACVARIARTVRETTAEGLEPAAVAANAAQASRWEREADELVDRGRGLAHSSQSTHVYARLLGVADDAADGLEDVAFFLTLLPCARAVAQLRAPLEHLATLLVSAADEWVRCVDAASAVRRRDARDGLEAFLESVDRLEALEDETDGAQRSVIAALFKGDADARALQLLLLVTHAFEQAADALARAALGLRDHLLEEVTSR